MTKVDPRSIDTKSKMKYLDLLWTSIAQLKTRNEVKLFFKDLLSESESIMLARRIEIAKLLMEGKSYMSIAQELKVGMDTINRVQRWLISGSGGYEKAIVNFEKEIDARFKKEDTSNVQELYTFGWIKQKYPFHFLLFNLLSDNKKSKIKK